ELLERQWAAVGGDGDDLALEDRRRGGEPGERTGDDVGQARRQVLEAAGEEATRPGAAVELDARAVELPFDAGAAAERRERLGRRPGGLREHRTERTEVLERARRERLPALGEHARGDVGEAALQHVRPGDRGAVAARERRERVDDDALRDAGPHLADQVLHDVLRLDGRERGEEL